MSIVGARRVSRAGNGGDLLTRPAPSPDEILATLKVQPRTHNSLKRYLAQATPTGTWTFARLMKIPGFGQRALADVLEALAGRSHLANQGRAERRFLEDEVTRLLAARRGQRPNLAAPLLARAVTVIASKLPASEADLVRRLVGTGLARGGIDLAQIERASRFSATPIPFSVLRRDGLTLAVLPADLARAATVYSLAGRAIVHWGLALVRRIAFQANTEDLAFVTTVLGAKSSFRWLDKTLGWFWFENPRASLVKAIEKILFVTSPLSVEELSQALFRRWAPDNVPSRRALAELCAQTPHFGVSKSGVTLVGAAALRDVLTEREHTVVDLFRRHGPKIEGHQLHEICDAIDQGAHRLGRYLRSSPFVLEPQPGVFRLIGT